MASGTAVRLALCLLLVAAPAAADDQPAAPAEATTYTVTAIRVHGNHSTPDDEVLLIARIAVGEPVSAGAMAAAQQRLEASGRFARVEIRQRSRSIDDPSQVALIILVAEHAAVRPVDLGVPSVPGPLGRLRSQTMFLPILHVRDGYGLTYGVRTSFVGSPQSATRVSVPASWGGTRQIAVEGERTFTSGSVAGAGTLTRLRSSSRASSGVTSMRRSASVRGRFWASAPPWARPACHSARWTIA
jgi:hypothetical protein